MNSFSHALPFLDQPYVAIGCGVPDWLGAADRKCRARKKKAIPFLDHSDAIVAAIAMGVVQHHNDDLWFHKGPTFNELNLKYAVQLRELYDNDNSMRSGFAIHVLIEMYIDAWLNTHFPGELERFYKVVASVDLKKIQDAINLFATQPTDKFVRAMKKFLELKYILDYMTDAGAIYRLNHVLKRVKLPKLDDRVHELLPTIRAEVYDQIEGLLYQYPKEIARISE